MAALERGRNTGTVSAEGRFENDSDITLSSYDYITAVFVGKAVGDVALLPLGSDGEPLPTPLPATKVESHGGVLLQAATTGIPGIRLHASGDVEFIEVFAGVTGLDY